MWEVREQRQGKSKHELDCVLRSPRWTDPAGKSKHKLDCVLRSPGWTDPVLGVLRLFTPVSSHSAVEESEESVLGEHP